jgi:hypothetical protein
MQKFDITLETMVVTSIEITEEKKTILYVSHECDDETGEIIWQFHSGSGKYDMANMRLVRLSTILAIDPGIAEISELPIGCAAIRQFPGASWEIAVE